MILYLNNLPFNPDKKRMAYCTKFTSLIEIMPPPWLCALYCVCPAGSRGIFLPSEAIASFSNKLTVGNFSNDLTPSFHPFLL